MNTYSAGSSFHNLIDATIRPFQAYQPKSGWGPILSNILTTYNLNVTYKFFPHFHPYVLQLAQELSQTDSVFDLLAMNVSYQANPDGSLQAIPNSTQAVLSSAPTVTQLLDANQNPVLSGAALILLDAS